MPVFSARGPLRSSTAFRITVLNPSIPYSANSHWISTDAILRHDKPQSQYATIRPLSNRRMGERSGGGRRENLQKGPRPSAAWAGKKNLP
ncbi:hypothetical protein CDAR_8641 [Caerostris darwini]|uniref:Ribosomal protein L2 n=1 Tax=Caerostris darwini TaxID=1538125 RepID=A0AAV4R573_9ARAC|nr:hypothetical protein CDAR_8641 [Caerostris darwini]